MRATAALVLIAALVTLCLAAAGGANPAAISDSELSQAHPISLGPAGAVRGTLEQPDASLLYRMDAIAGRTYIIETFAVQVGPGPGTSLTIYDAAGRYLTWGNLSGSGDADRGLMLVAPTDGPLYLKVAGRDGWTGAFSLRVLARFDQPGAAWGEDQEPNDWCELATSLSAGAEAEPHLLLAAEPSSVAHFPDVDSYRFQAEPEKTYEVLVAGLPQGSRESAVSLQLHDLASGEFLGPNAYARSIGPSVHLVQHFAQSAEVCALVVGGVRPAFWSGPYTIRLCEGRCTPTLFLPLVWR